MKIDFEILDTMEAAGAPAKAIIAYLRTQFERDEAKKAKKRPKDKERKRVRRAATRGGQRATRGGHVEDSERHAATLSDTPRARLFREGAAALLTMNISEDRGNKLMGQWLKLTNNDDQLVTATILRARDLAVPNPIGWILATLRGKQNGERGNSPIGQAFDRLIAESESRECEADFGGTNVTVLRS